MAISKGSPPVAMPPAQTPYEGKSVAATEFAYSRHSGLPVDWITRPLRNTFSKQEGILVFQFGLKDASTPELLIQLLRRDIKMKKEANKLKTFLTESSDGIRVIELIGVSSRIVISLVHIIETILLGFRSLLPSPTKLRMSDTSFLLFRRWHELSILMNCYSFNWRSSRNTASLGMSEV